MPTLAQFGVTSLPSLLADVFGFTAALFTLAAFAQRSMLPMRVTAIGANLFFISYGALGGYHPVLALHLILLPLNVARCFGERLGKTHLVQEPTQKGQPGLMDWV